MAVLDVAAIPERTRPRPVVDIILRYVHFLPAVAFRLAEPSVGSSAESSRQAPRHPESTQQGSATRSTAGNARDKHPPQRWVPVAGYKHFDLQSFHPGGALFLSPPRHRNCATPIQQARDGTMRRWIQVSWRPSPPRPPPPPPPCTPRAASNRSGSAAAWPWSTMGWALLRIGGSHRC